MSFFHVGPTRIVQYLKLPHRSVNSSNLNYIYTVSELKQSGGTLGKSNFRYLENSQQK